MSSGGDVKRAVHSEPVRTGFLEDGDAGEVRMVDTDHPLPVGSSTKIPLQVTGPEIRALANDVAEIKNQLAALLIHVAEMTGLRLSCGDI